MIFAAGLGTRLMPLTNNKPKAMVEVGGKPMLEIVIRKLIKYGFDEIVVNVHHHAEIILKFLKKNNNFNIKIHISDERDFLLETGGGLKKAKEFLDYGEPFLVHNVDILTNFDLKEFYDAHISNDAIVTLAITNRKSIRSLLFDENNVLCGWQNTQTSKRRVFAKDSINVEPKAFSGIHMIDPQIFKLMEREGAYSIMDIYLNLPEGNFIKGFYHDKSDWLDIGSHESLAIAELLIKEKKFY